MLKELYIYAHYNQYSKEIEYQICTYRRTEDSGDVLIEERTLEFDTLEEKEAKVKLAAALKMKLSKMRAEHYQEEKEQEETIQELLSLEFHPEVTTSNQVEF